MEGLCPSKDLADVGFVVDETPRSASSTRTAKVDQVLCQPQRPEVKFGNFKLAFSFIPCPYPGVCPMHKLVKMNL